MNSDERGLVLSGLLPLAFSESHSGRDPPSSISNQVNAQVLLTGRSDGATPLLRFPLPKCVELRTEIASLGVISDSILY